MLSQIVKTLASLGHTWILYRVSLRRRTGGTGYEVYKLRWRKNHGTHGRVNIASPMMLLRDGDSSSGDLRGVPSDTGEIVCIWFFNSAALHTVYMYSLLLTGRRSWRWNGITSPSDWNSNMGYETMG